MKSPLFVLLDCSIPDPLLAACDPDENIYILSKSSIIYKFDYTWRFIKQIQLSITDPIWLSINYRKPERLFVCTKSVLYCCDLDGIILFRITDIFKDLRCLTFDRYNNILVVDDSRILEIRL